MNSAHLTVSTFSSPAGLPLATNRCFFFSLHPWIFKNSSNSNTRLLQHDHPLLPSWKTGCPGWCTHFSSSRGTDGSYPTLQHFRRQVAFAGISRSGSSESGSSATGVGVVAGGVGATARETAGRGGSAVTGLGGGGTSSAFAAVESFSGSAGVSSTVEWTPVVQGAIFRKSSKVRTRGLQHFQPIIWGHRMY